MLRGLVLLALLVVLAGCEKEEKPVPAATPTPVPQTVPDADWRAVVDDWYDNGVFDEPHTCAAVRETIERLPTRDLTPAIDDLEAYATLVCGDG